MKRCLPTLALVATAWAAACGGNTTSDRTASGGSAGSNGSAGASGNAGSAGRGGSSGAGGSGIDAAGGSGGDPAVCQSAREAYQSAVDRNTRCDLSVDRAECAFAAPGECCPLSVGDASQAEEMSLRVAQLGAACGPSACPGIVCPPAPSQHCQAKNGSPIGRCL